MPVKDQFISFNIKSFELEKQIKTIANVRLEAWFGDDLADKRTLEPTKVIKANQKFEFDTKKDEFVFLTKADSKFFLKVFTLDSKKVATEWGSKETLWKDIKTGLKIEIINAKQKKGEQKITCTIDNALPPKDAFKAESVPDK